MRQPAALPAARAAGFELVRLKNKFAAEERAVAGGGTVEGLPNLHVNLRVAAPRPDAQEAMVVEMQLYTHKTLELKGMQHRCYKITRAERMETVA